MTSLSGLMFLVVEDEPLIAMDISTALQDEGARVTTTTTLKHAQLLVENDGLAGAIVDHSLGDGDSSVLRARLKERGIPFLVYSGFEIQGEPFLSKPAPPAQLIAAVQALISARPGTDVMQPRSPPVPIPQDTGSSGLTRPAMSCPPDSEWTRAQSRGQRRRRRF